MAQKVGLPVGITVSNWYVYLLAFKHCKKGKKQMMLDLITVALAVT